MAWMWKFNVTCNGCGHRNRPHNSYRQALRMALLRQLPPCRRCGKELRCTLRDTPLVRQLRQELEEQGLLPTDTPAEASPASVSTPS